MGNVVTGRLVFDLACFTASEAATYDELVSPFEIAAINPETEASSSVWSEACVCGEMAAALPDLQTDCK